MITLGAIFGPFLIIAGVVYFILRISLLANRIRILRQRHTARPLVILIIQMSLAILCIVTGFVIAGNF
jgi:hypothetical protein